MDDWVAPSWKDLLTGGRHTYWNSPRTALSSFNKLIIHRLAVRMAYALLNDDLTDRQVYNENYWVQKMTGLTPEYLYTSMNREWGVIRHNFDWFLHKLGGVYRLYVHKSLKRLLGEVSDAEWNAHMQQVFNTIIV